MQTKEDPLMNELEEKLPSELLPLLNRRDGAALLAEKLPKIFSHERIATTTNEQRAWELVGLFYLTKGRFHEALSIFAKLYDHMLEKKREGQISTINKALSKVESRPFSTVKGGCFGLATLHVG